MRQWMGIVANRFEFKCAVCSVCDGRGCVGQMPGMGGVNNNKNFKLNFEGWKKLRQKAVSEGTIESILSIPVETSAVRAGPVTGAVQNIGFEKEEYFYLPYFSAARCGDIGLCVGDGYPDYKLHYGLDAVRKLQKAEPDLKAAVFLKPYPNEKLFERIEAARGAAEIIGNDIDSYNIETMRNLVRLEKKTPAQISEIRKRNFLQRRYRARKRSQTGHSLHFESRRAHRYARRKYGGISCRIRKRNQKILRRDLG